MDVVDQQMDVISQGCGRHAFTTEEMGDLESILTDASRFLSNLGPLTEDRKFTAKDIALVCASLGLVQRPGSPVPSATSTADGPAEPGAKPKKK